MLTCIKVYRPVQLSDMMIYLNTVVKSKKFDYYYYYYYYAVGSTTITIFRFFQIKWQSPLPWKAVADYNRPLFQS